MADLTVTRDNIFSLQRPQAYNRLRNVVSIPIVSTSPKSTTPEEVYRSKGPEGVPATGGATVTVEYSETPVIDRAIGSYPAPTVTANEVDPTTGEEYSPARYLTIDDAEYYGWGAVIQVASDGVQRVFNIHISGIAFESSEGLFVLRDEASIQDYGEREYKAPENPLIQSRATATQIAQSLVNQYSGVGRQAVVTWRGNPALEIGDTVNLPVYARRGESETEDFILTRQELDFDGALVVQSTGILSPTYAEWQETYSTGTEYVNTLSDSNPRYQEAIG